MTAWTYGDEGRAHPVRPGDLWRVGEHLFMCGDVEAAGIDVFRTAWEGHGYSPKLVYVDLPYNAGLARGYRTKAGVDGERGRAVDYDALLFHLLDSLRLDPPPWIYLETGHDSVERVIETARLLDYSVRGVFTITYHEERPAGLVAMRQEDGLTAPAIFEGEDDEQTPELAIRAHTARGDAVFDPMVGRGLTAVSAAGLERVALGMELAPARLSACLVEMEKVLGEPAVLERLPRA